MNKINRIKELISILIPACTAYYKLDKPIMSDKQYDDLYLELETLEYETGYIQSNSVTQKVQGEVLDSLVKVKHTELMLSAEKSKNINDAIKFMNSQSCVLSWKLDGLTIVAKYNNGEFYQALTRGGGDYGEDVSHSFRQFANIPLKIDYEGYLEIRGEAMIKFSDFNRINDELIANGEEPYASPRNLAAGTVRQLDSNVTKSRNPIFIAFGIVKCDESFEYKDEQFMFLLNLGFQVVESVLVNKTTLPILVDVFKSKIEQLEYLTDGLIVEYRNIAYGKAQGETGHHSKALWAIKWEDDTYPSIFEGVDLNTTRTGIVSITGMYTEVNIDGVRLTRASLHNYDIFEELQLGVGDSIQVYRCNSVIPQIYDNETRSGTYKINMTCPSCGEEIFIKQPKTARFLFCVNPHCPAQLVDKISHAVGNDALNIIGLSSATIEKFIECGFIKEIADIYKLEQHKDQIVKMDGMGNRSYEKLIKSVNISRDTEMYRVIYAMGIKNIGRSASKAIAKHFDYNMDRFIKAMQSFYDFTVIEDFGGTTSESLHNWFAKGNMFDMSNLLAEISIKKPEIKKDNSLKDLSGLTFVVTGNVHSFKNRKELEELITSLSGKLSGSVSKSTSFLLNNDITSISGKNQKANELNVKIISEDQFNTMIGRNI